MTDPPRVPVRSGLRFAAVVRRVAFARPVRFPVPPGPHACSCCSRWMRRRAFDCSMASCRSRYSTSRSSLPSVHQQIACPDQLAVPHVDGRHEARADRPHDHRVADIRRSPATCTHRARAARTGTTRPPGPRPTRPRRAAMVHRFVRCCSLDRLDGPDRGRNQPRRRSPGRQSPDRPRGTARTRRSSAKRRPGSASKRPPRRTGE